MALIFNRTAAASSSLPSSSSLTNYAERGTSLLHFQRFLSVFYRKPSLITVSNCNNKKKKKPDSDVPSITQLDDLVKDLCKSKDGVISMDNASNLIEPMFHMQPLPPTSALNYLLGAIARRKRYLTVLSLYEKITAI